MTPVGFNKNFCQKLRADYSFPNLHQYLQERPKEQKPVATLARPPKRSGGDAGPPPKTFRGNVAPSTPEMFPWQHWSAPQNVPAATLARTFCGIDIEAEDLEAEDLEKSRNWEER